MDELGQLPATTLPRGTSREQLRRAYRAAAKRLHPDAGGDPALFRALQADFAAALAEFDTVRSPAHGHYRNMSVATQTPSAPSHPLARRSRPVQQHRPFAQVLATQMARHGMAWA